MRSDGCGPHVEDTEYSEDFDSDGDAQRKTIMMKKTLVTAKMTAVVRIFRFWRPGSNSHSSDRFEMLKQKPNFCVASRIVHELKSSSSGLD